jgi:hypothetical protein
MNLEPLRKSDISGVRLADLFEQMFDATDGGAYPAFLTLDFSTGDEAEGDMVPQIQLALRRVTIDPANPPAPETTA